MRDVKWTDEATDQLLHIIGWLAERNSEAAELLLLRIERLIAIAAESPALFRYGRVAGTREIIVHANYIIVFRSMNPGTEILAILHARQAWPAG